MNLTLLTRLSNPIARALLFLWAMTFTTSPLSAGVLTTTHAGEKRHPIQLPLPAVAYQRGTPIPAPTTAPIEKTLSKSAQRKQVRKERMENFRIAIKDALSKPAQVSPQRTNYTKDARQQKGTKILRIGGIVAGALLMVLGVALIIVALVIFFAPAIALLILILGIIFAAAGLLTLLLSILL